MRQKSDSVRRDSRIKRSDPAKYETPGALQDSGSFISVPGEKSDKKDGKTENFQEKAPKKTNFLDILGARVSLSGKAVASPESLGIFVVIR